MAVASAGLYASLHLIPDNHANIPPLSFLQAGCPSCRPTDSVKALTVERICGKGRFRAGSEKVTGDEIGESTKEVEVMEAG